MDDVLPVVLHHHEWWNGSGYPFGAAGEQIPLSARIVAIVDVYDAMSLRRVYKEPIPHDECVAYILEQAGKQFDPDLVEVFLKIAHQFRDTAQGYVGSTVVEKPSNVEGLTSLYNECGAYARSQGEAPSL